MSNRRVKSPEICLFLKKALPTGGGEIFEARPAAVPAAPVFMAKRLP
jgi:hypothetical protein